MAYCLPATAALRAGAGKLQIATATDAALPLAIAMPEALVMPLACNARGDIVRASAQLRSEAAHAQAIAIGSGMPATRASCRIAKALLEVATGSVLLDAGALGACAHSGGAQPIITPHPGEMAELTGEDVDVVTARPAEIAVEFAAGHNVIVVLKGPTTFIAHPDGRSWVQHGGVVGLGTSGSGDVLAGLIAGLAARGAEPEQAAAWGVWLHAQCRRAAVETAGHGRFPRTGNRRGNPVAARLRPACRIMDAGHRGGFAMIELVIDQRRKDLGGFEVGRVLPFAAHRMVGPFVFFDHMGPVDFAPGIPRSVDVRPHPHIGLSTITYLFAGEIMHRDSVGSEQPIRPGEVNWMTAGRGITHSERFEQARRSGGHMDGIQAWVALPVEDEESDPAFAHHDATELPVIESPGARMRLIAGSAWGITAPVTTHSPMAYTHCTLEAGARLSIPVDYAERAIYVASGAVEIDHQRFEAGRMIVLSPRVVGERHRPVAGGADAACGRTGRRAVRRVEFRILVARTDPAGQGRLGGRAYEVAGPRPRGMDPAAA